MGRVVIIRPEIIRGLARLAEAGERPVADALGIYLPQEAHVLTDSLAGGGIVALDSKEMLVFEVIDDDS